MTPLPRITLVLLSLLTTIAAINYITLRSGRCDSLTTRGFISSQNDCNGAIVALNSQDSSTWVDANKKASLRGTNQRPPGHGEVTPTQKILQSYSLKFCPYFDLFCPKIHLFST